jgi:hypothetical protein
MSESRSRVGRNHGVVAINFCGGCNPMIDRRDIALEIKDALAERGFSVAFNNRTADATIQLSGCARNCVASQQATDRPAVAIAGSSIDAFGVDEDQLAQRAATAVMTLLDGRSTGTAEHHADDALPRHDDASLSACKDHEESR